MQRLVVAIHDVAPDYLDEIRFLLSALDRAGARPRVLKFIPENLGTSPELVQILIDEQRQGSEIVQHGFSHRTSGPFRGPWTRRLRASIFAQRDAEFLSLVPAEMASRLSRGRNILQGAGLSVSGFCAPGWLETPELPSILRGCGFRYNVAMTSVVDLANRRRIRTDWLGYMGAGRIQENLVGIADGVNRATAPLFSVLKVFLHPQQARSNAACGRILDLIPALVRDRTLTTYGQLVAG
jgi:predicted deacetylase